MVRPHGELLYDTGFGSVGVGASTVWFPNGSIRSTQVAFTYERSLEAIVSPGWLDGATVNRSLAGLEQDGPLSTGNREFAVTSHLYLPRRGTKNTDGTRGDKAIGLIGAEMRQFLDRGLFLRLAAAGAAAGEADGYAQVQTGAGCRLLLPGHSAVTAGITVGAAGGGKIDTGGGFVAGADAGIRHWFGERWSAGISGGYLLAPDGDFRTVVAGIDLAYGIDPVAPAGAGWQPAWWRMRGGCQSYLPTGRIRKSGSDRDSVDLFAVKLDRMFSPHLFLTGQAMGAFDGGVGGYAVGMLGGGLTAPLGETPLFVNGELLVGAGGGGGVATGGGVLLQPMAGIGWQFGRQAGLLASGGVVAAPDGRLVTAVADLSLVYRFTTAERR
jgi:hypothetical protein